MGFHALHKKHVHYTYSMESYFPYQKIASSSSRPALQGVCAVGAREHLFDIAVAPPPPPPRSSQKGGCKASGIRILHHLVAVGVQRKDCTVLLLHEDFKGRIHTVFWQQNFRGRICTILCAGSMRTSEEG